MGPARIFHIHTIQHVLGVDFKVRNYNLMKIETLARTQTRIRCTRNDRENLIIAFRFI